MKEYMWLLFVVMGFVSACGGVFQAGSDVQSGRLAFSIGNYQMARTYFAQAAQVDPNYVYNSDLPGGSIQSYLGRADYETKRYASARRLLQQALAINKNDNVARLYLGLTLAQMGDRENGLKEIQAGLKGLYDWIVYVRKNFSAGNEYGQFWDQNGTIRAAIQVDLSMIASGQIDWPKLLADGASIGKQMDNEIDVAMTDQRIIVTEAISGR
jgi:tetratricopeptide (TPR) repeat protein